MQLEVADKRRLVLELWRRPGMTYRMIAAATGYSTWSVGEIVRSALKEAHVQMAGQHLAEHVARLEELFRLLYPAVADSCPERVDVNAALSILDRQSRIMGLEPPKRSVSIGVRGNQDIGQLLGLLIELLQRQGRVPDGSGEAIDGEANVGELAKPQPVWALPGLAAANDGSMPIAEAPRSMSSDANARRQREELDRQMAAIYSV